MPGKQIDLQIKQRSKFEYEFFVNDGLKPPTGINISNRVYQSQMRRFVFGPLVAEFTFVPRDQTMPDTVGRVAMTLPASVTTNLSPGLYVYDVFQTIGNADPEVVFFGTVEVIAAVTR